MGLDINDTGYTSPDLNLAARAQAEIDSVESTSPYVFNCSINPPGVSVVWADGSKATGFKSMVVAQCKSVSLQKTTVLSSATMSSATPGTKHL